MTAHIPRAIFGEAVSRGLSLDDLCERFEIAPATLQDIDGRVSAPVAVRVWEEVPVLCGDPDFGLHLAEKASLAAASVVGYIFQSSANLRDGLIRSVRYQRLLQDVKVTRIDPIEGGVCITHGTGPDDPPVPRHAVEFGMAMGVVLAQQATRTNVQPIDVAFECPAPESVSEHLRIFGVRPRFGVAVNRLVFDDIALDRPIRTADSALCSLLERHASEMLARIPEPSDLLARVRRSLCDELRGGDPSLEVVAAKMHRSARTLQRELREHGLSFQALLDELRRDLALRYLRDEAMGLDEVAFLLGFNDASAFHRAFVRWTGKTPGRHRRDAV